MVHSVYITTANHRCFWLWLNTLQSSVFLMYSVRQFSC